MNIILYFNTIHDIASPGGWTQLAVKIVWGEENITFSNLKPKVIAVDINPMEPVHGAHIFRADFTDPLFRRHLSKFIGDGTNAGKCDVVLSDMAPSFCGDAATDHFRTLKLVNLALSFAVHHLVVGGTFLTKTFEGADHQVTYIQSVTELLNFFNICYLFCKCYLSCLTHSHSLSLVNTLPAFTKRFKGVFRRCEDSEATSK